MRLSLIVIILLTGWAIEPGDTCLSVMDELFGTLNPSLEIKRTKLGPSSSPCSCCGLCNQYNNCRSFSFNMHTNKCILYSTVGSYGRFIRDVETNHTWQFFIMPRASLTGEFCQSDSDCIQHGNFCRARMCTTEDLITCWNIYLKNTALPDHRFMGHAEGKDLLLFCRMQGSYNGSTLMLASHDPATNGVPWSKGNILYKTFKMKGYPREELDYSILRYADLFRDQGDSTDYVINIIAREFLAYPDISQTFTAPKSLSLLSYEIIPYSSGLFQISPELRNDAIGLAFPRLNNVSSCPSLYTTFNRVCTRDRQYRTLVRPSGYPWWPVNQKRETVLLYLRPEP